MYKIFGLNAILKDNDNSEIDRMFYNIFCSGDYICRDKEELNEYYEALLFSETDVIQNTIKI